MSRRQDRRHHGASEGFGPTAGQLTRDCGPTDGEAECGLAGRCQVPGRPRPRALLGTLDVYEHAASVGHGYAAEEAGE